MRGQQLYRIPIAHHVVGLSHLGEARRGRIRLITRNGYDFSGRFPLIVAAITALPVRSCALDGEAIACDENGLSVFERIRWRQHVRSVTLCAFDLIELDGEDLRRKAIDVKTHRTMTPVPSSATN